jgi:hypothetical protein
MANGGVALQGNGHRQVDGTCSETYTKLFSNMPYKIKDGRENSHMTFHI